MSDDQVVITETDLSRAWAHTLLAVAARPGHRAFHTITSISDVTNQDAGVRHVARYLRLLPQLKILDHNNNKGTYFQRLVGYAGASGDPVNQIVELVRKLDVELAAPGPKSARYEVSLAQPSAALPILDPERDTGAMAFPCLSLLSFQLDRRETLHAVAHYRSQYLLQRGYGNYLGIAGLMQYVAATAGLRPGRLTVVAGLAAADQVNKAQLARVRDALLSPA